MKLLQFQKLKIISQNKILVLYLTLGFKIYQKKFEPQNVTIKIKNPQQQFILFLVPDIVDQQISCGGELKDISIKLEDFISCDQSSYKENYDCKQGLTGQLQNEYWNSKDQSINSWISLKLQQDYEIRKIQFKNKDDINGMVKNLKLEFQDFQFENIEIRKNFKIQTFEFNKSIKTNQIKLIVQNVWNNAKEVGFSIILQGHKCLEFQNQNQKPKKKIDSNQVYPLYCGENILNSENLKQFQFKINDIIKVRCDNFCLDDKNQIFGFGKYSDDSYICISAYHSLLIDDNMKEFQIKIQDLIKNYDSKLSNGIYSKSKIAKGKFTIQLQSDSSNQFIPFNGMMIEIKQKDIWKSGLVQKVEKLDNKYRLTILDEMNQQKIIDWPNFQKLQFCGTYIKTVKCDQKSLKPQLQNAFEAKICFTKKGKCSDDYIIDQGKIKSQKQKYNFGWDTDMTKMIRCNNNNYENESLSCFMMFPPLFSQCQKESNNYVCQKVSWKIDVPNGNYKVNLKVFDNSNYFYNNLQVNGQNFFNNELSLKVFQNKEKEINVSDGTISLTANCENNCQKSWSRINSIEIYQIKQIQNFDNIQKLQQLDCNTQQGILKLQKGDYCNDENRDQIENCYWESQDKYLEKINQCDNDYKLIQIKKSDKCPKLLSGIKCIKIIYDNFTQCEKTCPYKCQQQKFQFTCESL